MTKNIVARQWGLPSIDGRRYSTGTPPIIPALQFVPGDAEDDDFATQTVLPPGFGNAEFTVSFYTRCISAGSTAWGTVDVGSTASVKKRRWSSNNVTIYSAGDYWTYGNFLLDGYNNTPGLAAYGGMSLQLTNTGRLQWLFGDGAAADARVGDTHCARGATSLLDGALHRIDLVRRWRGGGGADLEVWLDGVLDGSEITTARTAMYDEYWEEWTGFPGDEPGWFWGAEKISANGGNPWEDAFSSVGELALWDRALSVEELEAVARIMGNETGLVSLYRFDEQTGTSAADALSNGGNITLFNTDPGVWIEETP